MIGAERNHFPFTVIEGGNNPQQVPYLEVPLARYQRHAKERDALLWNSASVEDAQDIVHMNLHRQLKQPQEDIAAHITAQELGYPLDDNPPPAA